MSRDFVTTIQLSKATRDRIRRFGLKGQTYDDILNSLMSQVDYEQFMEQQYARLRDKDAFVDLEPGQ